MVSKLLARIPDGTRAQHRSSLKNKIRSKFQFFPRTHHTEIPSTYGVTMRFHKHDPRTRMRFVVSHHGGLSYSQPERTTCWLRRSPCTSPAKAERTSRESPAQIGSNQAKSPSLSGNDDSLGSGTEAGAEPCCGRQYWGSICAPKYSR